MKVVNYYGEKIRLHKGETLAIVTEYFGGKWAKPKKDLCIIKKKYFNNGHVKHGDFEIVQEIKNIQKGYSHRCASSHGRQFFEIETAEK